MNKQENKEIELRVSAIKSQIKYGDYQTAAKMLNISVDSLKARFIRYKEDAIDAIERVIENRENLIANYSKEMSNKSNK